MTQIKPIQIIPGRENKVNPVASLPIDLRPSQRNLSLDSPTTVSDPAIDSIIGNGISDDFVGDSEESVLTDSDPTPAVPAIIGVKEQIIKFQEDGTAKIDVVLEVQDIPEAVEYDIRVAKDAGNL